MTSETERLRAIYERMAGGYDRMIGTWERLLFEDGRQWVCSRSRGSVLEIGAAPMADFIMEPKVGGRWYELGVDGKQCDTGRVTAYEPPERVVFAGSSMNAGSTTPTRLMPARWKCDSSPRVLHKRGSLDLEHRGFERHGAGANGVRGGIDAPTGWTYVLDLFAKHAAA
ncbi:MAG: hypothetical protein LC797_24155 [Chloroflexi bacterium]|nr:hypothetical protein [Chloroflexota bacterium]